ncbi:MAG: hypothetical protein P4N24_09370 [Acidobacteriota bacterium]|nr:hypothetical protein [Acidobacteriota bacterium]
MDAKAIRIVKEGRALFWPWCAVTLAGALPLLHPPDAIAWITPFAFFLGIPLLAALSYGNEFQHQTFSLLLSQPVSRREIWWEKLVAMLLLVALALLVFVLSSATHLIWEVTESFEYAGAWTIGIVASATFWTLLSRSTVGGVILNITVHAFAILLWSYWSSGTPSGSADTTFASLIALIFWCYVGVMLWLGWRQLARLQATGTMAGDDLIVAGPDVMPRAFAAWFRCRPRGATLNLIRKELRLLRPVWLFSLLSALGWTALTAVELLHQRKPADAFPVASLVVGVSCAVIIAILAGSMSLGEEKTSGRHAWHMTLPVSAWRQWLVKLLTALFVGVVCAGLLPLLLLGGGRLLLGARFLGVDADFPWFWLCAMLLLCAASFWCACAASGTVSAVLWLFPMLIAIPLAPAAAAWIVDKYEWRLMTCGVAHSSNFRLAVGLANVTYRFASTFHHLRFYHPYLRGVPPPALLIVCLITLIVAVIQSYRMFRRPLPSGTFSVPRKLGLLVLPAFLFCLFGSGWEVFTYAAWNRAAAQVSQTELAIYYLLAESPNLETGHPLELTEQDLGHTRYFPTKEFPAETLRWLRNAHITVVPLGRVVEQRQLTGWYFVATIRLESGTELTLSQKPNDRFTDYPIPDVRVRWPGATHDEPLWAWQSP